jgi:hypothetical protein
MRTIIQERTARAICQQRVAFQLQYGAKCTHRTMQYDVLRRVETFRGWCITLLRILEAVRACMVLPFNGPRVVSPGQLDNWAFLDVWLFRKFVTIRCPH